ncbi:MAG: YitT family protein [Defluviitaleaceae bacterium]|nr:YitT family protein [Defluviitaleaceae bacterium]
MNNHAKHLKKTLPSFIGSLTGALLFVIAINVIIVPHQLYSGTITGVAQMIESILTTYTRLVMPQSFNLTGTILLLLNIPLMILVVKVTGSNFPAKSIVTIIFMTVAMSFVPIPSQPLVYDPLAAAIVGGALAGFGAGFTLRCGGSGGGTDLIGVYCSVKYPNFTVGKVSLFIGAFVYSYSLFFYDLNITIYSALFTVIYAFALDHTHHQNIKTSALIFSSKPDAMGIIMEQLGRGVTCWEGKGAYSGNHTHIFTTVISKYEVPNLKRIVKEADPRAFIIFSNNVDVTGNFKRKL